MAFRYKTTPHMTIIRLKDNKEFQLPEISFGNYAGTNTVLYVNIDGKKRSIFRSTIDETAFSLGPAAVYKKKGKGKKHTPQPTQDAPAQPAAQAAVVVKQEQFVSISKEELVNIHRALQAAADATQRLLVRLILQS